MDVNSCAVRHKTAFKDLKEADCTHIDTLREVKVVKAGNPILFKDKNESAFYCLQQGHVQLGFADKFKAGIVRICGPGDLVGYESTEVTPVAEVIEDSVLCLIKRKPFVEVQKINPDISNGIIQALVRIIAIKNERIIGLENHSVKNRIATTLLSLMKKFGTRSEWGTLIDVKLERKILAKLAGTVVESLARTLTELEDEKIIHRQARQIHVVNKEKLIHFSNQ
ncbi:MAG: Crp/Fnr family transcriptional regulator [Bdellovibrio sp.]|nr:Crp/Fnr family transcriptional regulator [Bdellovibrio sp.]